MVLKRRSERRGAVESGPAERQFVLFRVGSERYAFDISQVSEIDRMQPVTKVPNALPFVEGVIHLREMIIPVIDLAKRFGQPPVEPGRQTRVIIARLRDQRVGFIVHEVSEVLAIPEAEIGAAPPLTFDPATRFVAGMARLKEGLVSILSLDRLLSREEVEQLQQQQLF